MKKLLPLAVVGLCLSFAGSALAQSGNSLFDRLSASQLAPIFHHGDIHILPVQGNVFMIVAGDVNVTASVGPDGILLVDTGPARLADALLEALQLRFDNKPVRYIVQTHADPEHIGATATIVRAMQKRGMTASSPRPGSQTAYQVLALDATDQRLNGSIPDEAEVEQEGRATLPFLTTMKLHFNGEAVQLIPVPEAHTDGDVIVFFRGSDVISASDVYSTKSFPIVEVERGGSVAGTLKALNLLLDLTVPEYNQQGGTRVIPGHGHLSNESDVDDYRNWMTIVRDRVRTMVKAGKTKEQVLAAHVSLDFEPMYDGNKDWTGSKYVEIAYDELAVAEKP